MHEVAAIQGVVSSILETLQQKGGTRVIAVQLVLGTSGHFSEEAARQHFAMLAAGTPAENAALEITWLPATYQCFSCLHRFESGQVAEPMTCPRCGDIALETGHQDACYASAIEMAFDGDAGEERQACIARSREFPDGERGQEGSYVSWHTRANCRNS